MPIEPKARTNSSYLSPRSEKVRRMQGHNTSCGLLSAGAASHALRNTGSIGSEEQLSLDLLRTPSRRSSKNLPSSRSGA